MGKQKRLWPRSVLHKARSYLKNNQQKKDWWSGSSARAGVRANSFLDAPLAKLTKRQREKTKINKIRDEKRDIKQVSMIFRDH
jgi:hypothetical protein